VTIFLFACHNALSPNNQIPVQTTFQERLSAKAKTKQSNKSNTILDLVSTLFLVFSPSSVLPSLVVICSIEFLGVLVVRESTPVVRKSTLLSNLAETSFG
jgi:hypothetical protein